MEVKRGEDIHEDPWDFLEKELQNFQKVLKDLEAGKQLEFGKTIKKILKNNFYQLVTSILRLT